MTINELLRTVASRWQVAVAILALGIALSGVFVLIRTPDYSAQTSLFVSTQDGGSVTQAFQGAQLSEQRVKSYSELATSDRVMLGVVAQLGLQSSIEDLRGTVEATNAIDSVIINITATDSDPLLAASLADAVASQTSQLITELERPEDSANQPTVAVRVIQPASIPQESSSASWAVVLAAGVLAGASLGIGGALLASAVDTTIKNTDDLTRSSGFPVLGTTVKDKTSFAPATVVLDHPQSIAAESYRKIRTNLNFVQVDRRLTTLLFTSPSPNEGKSTTAISMAIAHASGGSRVLIIDADLRRPTIGYILGLESTVGLTSVLTGQVQVSRAIQTWRGGTLDVLASGVVPPNPSELLSSHQFRALIDELKKRYDLIIVDAPPTTPVTDAVALAPIVDGVILIAKYKSTRRPYVNSFASAMQVVEANIVGSILTSVPHYANRAEYRSYISEAEATKAQTSERTRFSSRESSITASSNAATAKMPASSPNRFGRQQGKE